MPSANSACSAERQKETVILTPTANVRELEYGAFEAAVYAALEMLESGDIRHVVIDFARTEHFSSHAITLMLKLGSATRSGGGTLALVGLSDQEKELLKVTKLDAFWPTHSSREEALETV